MSSEPVTLWCTLQSVTGKENALRRALQDLCVKVHDVETNCLRYELLEKTTVENGQQRVTFHLLETWQSEGDLDKHTKRDWLIRHRQHLINDGLLAGEERIEKVVKIGGFLSRP